MAELFPNDIPAANRYSTDGPARSSLAPPGHPGAPLELPVTSTASVSARGSSAQLNRSAEAVGRRVGNAVAGVKSIPQQFERLRARIHLVDRGSEGGNTSLAEVAGDWRDAVEGSVSEISQAAQCYRVEFLDRANERLRALQHRSERKYFELRLDFNHRVDKVRRLSREQPLQFVAGCAATAFVLGVAVRVWRSNHE